jgi:hypothetical protein
VNPDLLVYDYAVGGDNVLGLEDQVKKRFLPHAGRQPDWAPWKSDNTLFGMDKVAARLSTRILMICQ